MEKKERKEKIDMGLFVWNEWVHSTAAITKALIDRLLG